MKTRTAVLAAAAGALFLAGAPALAAEGKDAKIKCEGVNSCKGHSDCSTAQNQCAGKNSCKGKGFKKMTPEECKAAKAAMGVEKEG